jgi:hypothetical protein
MVVFLTIPGLAILLILLAAVDGLGMWAHRRVGLPWRKNSERPLSAPGLDEMHAMLYAGKRQELDHKRSSLMMRDDTEDSAPPRSSVDLDRGRAIIRLSSGGTQPPGSSHLG